MGLLGCPLCFEGVAGVLVVETIGRIRREPLVKGESIKEIARDLKIVTGANPDPGESGERITS